MRRTEFLQRSPRKNPDGDKSRFAILAFVASVTVDSRPVAAASRVAGLQCLCTRGSACLALAAGLHRPRSARLPPSAWNLAGAFTLVGCAAAILGEIEAIVEYMRLTPPRSRADD